MPCRLAVPGLVGLFRFVSLRFSRKVFKRRSLVFVAQSVWDHLVETGVAVGAELVDY